MTYGVRLSLCHNFPNRAGYTSANAYALVNSISQAKIKVTCVCSKGLYAYTNTAYRRTDKFNKVNKGSEGVGEAGVAKGGGGGKGGDKKNGRAKKLV